MNINTKKQEELHHSIAEQFPTYDEQERLFDLGNKMAAGMFNLLYPHQELGQHDERYRRLWRDGAIFALFIFLGHIYAPDEKSNAQQEPE